MTEEETANPPRAGQMRLTAGVLQHYVPPTPGGWEAMPIWSAPREFTVRAPGWWYIPREMEGVWHPERHDLVELRRWGREERAVALALLRCALRTLEEMED